MQESSAASDVTLAQVRQAEAWAKYKSPVMRALLRTGAVQTTEDAEDVYAEAFVAAIQQWDRLDADRFVNWLHTVARRKAADSARKRKREARLIETVRQISGDA